jgi:hypothetical protein
MKDKIKQAFREFLEENPEHAREMGRVDCTMKEFRFLMKTILKIIEYD